MSNKNGTKSIWKSLKDYQDDPELLESKLHEFKEGVTDDFDLKNMTSFSRRKFLAILAASSAYATTACTNYRDKGEIVPYVNRPEEVLPGKPTFYATTFAEDGINYGLLVKTREGRPIKLDGNDDDPINNGKIPSRVQASILNLYDPDRLQHPTKEKSQISWEKVIDEVKSILSNASKENKEIAIFTNPITSPTTFKVIEDFKSKFPSVKVYTIHLANNNNRISSWKKCYNQNVVPSIRWDKAKVILALESDFLGKEGNTVENRQKYSKARNIVDTKNLNKLYVVEGPMSLTGMNADIRLRLNPQLQFNFVLSLINELLNSNTISSANLSNNVLNLIKQNSLNSFAEKSGLKIAKLKNLVEELAKNKNEAIVYAGDSLPEEVHNLVNLLNDLLGNENLQSFENGFIYNTGISSSNDIKEFVENCNNGNVASVINFDANPVYELTDSFGIKDALKEVEYVISISEVPNETNAISKYVLPSHHFLESWGDHKTRVGLLYLQQPVISPIFDTKQKEEILLSLCNDEAVDYHKYLMNNFKDNVYSVSNSAADFDTYWYTALHDGVLKVADKKIKKNTIDQNVINNLKNNIDGITLILQNNYSIGTGKYINNGWLQELPHPVTKVTWDNFAALAPATAKSLRIENDDLIKISVNGKSVKLPVIVQPGMAENTVALEFGYGRENSGEVADKVGFNINSLLNENNVSQFIFGGASITKTGDTYNLASTQEHHSLNDEFVKDFHRIRKIIQDGTLDEYKNNPKFLDENKEEIFSINKPPVEYKNEKWVMSIDLNKCLGCSECVSSCNVENNVPVVGKDQVLRGREMQWMRIDRYYSGTPEEPIVSTQPMLCQHCDNAPCENVCPVNATNHSPDGLNQMVYNRCVGTRYCLNNCPYKVRRFNFYNFRDHFADAYYENELSYLVNNPEVTVRSRGVMEKCTFCVQNIMQVREDAIRENRPIKANEVKTACQIACPTNAIEFGDSNNPDSKVNKFRDHDLGYSVLEDLNVKPNVTYVAKIRNTRAEDV